MTGPIGSEDDPLVQMNVRVLESMKDRIDSRRARLGISRDEIVRRMLDFALDHPTAVTPAVRTSTAQTVRAPVANPNRTRP